MRLFSAERVVLDGVDSSGGLKLPECLDFTTLELSPEILHVVGVDQRYGAGAIDESRFFVRGISEVTVFDFTNPKRVTSRSVESAHPMVSVNGNYLFVISWWMTVCVYDLDCFEKVAEVELEERVRDFIAVTETSLLLKTDTGFCLYDHEKEGKTVLDVPIGEIAWVSESRFGVVKENRFAVWEIGDPFSLVHETSFDCDISKFASNSGKIVFGFTNGDIKIVDSENSWAEEFVGNQTKRFQRVFITSDGLVITSSEIAFQEWRDRSPASLFNHDETVYEILEMGDKLVAMSYSSAYIWNRERSTELSNQPVKPGIDKLASRSETVFGLVTDRGYETIGVNYKRNLITPIEKFTLEEDPTFDVFETKKGSPSLANIENDLFLFVDGTPQKVGSNLDNEFLGFATTLPGGGVIACYSDPKIRYWKKFNDQEPEYEIDLFGSNITALDNDTIVVSYEMEEPVGPDFAIGIRLWNLNNPLDYKTAFAHDGNIMFITPIAEQVFATGGVDGRVKIWDYNCVVHELTPHIGGARVAKLLTKTRLATSGGDGIINIWDTTNWTLQKSIDISPFGGVGTLEKFGDSKLISNLGPDYAVWNI